MSPRVELPAPPQDLSDANIAILWGGHKKLLFTEDSPELMRRLETLCCGAVREYPDGSVHPPEEGWSPVVVCREARKARHSALTLAFAGTVFTGLGVLVLIVGLGTTDEAFEAARSLKGGVGALVLGLLSLGFAVKRWTRAGEIEDAVTP